MNKMRTRWAFVAFALTSVLVFSLVGSAFPLTDSYGLIGCIEITGIHELPEKCPVGIFEANHQSQRIAFIEPVFTTTAYSSFYTFYAKYGKTPPGVNVTTDLNLLNATLQMGWGHSLPLYMFLKSSVASEAGLVIGKNAFILTDIDVDQGKLFSPVNGSRLYNFVVLGFSEYVTAAEYRAFQKFVATGGTLVILSATTFLAQVAYYPKASKVALVGGNAWYFNGHSAWKGRLGMWYQDNTNWVGSNYALFYASGRYKVNGAIANATNPYGWALYQVFGPVLFKDYTPHEENLVSNSTDRIIARWNLIGHNGTLAVYEHYFGKGKVVHIGVFGTDIIMKDAEMQFLLLTVLGLLQVNARIFRNGCVVNVFAWPTLPSGSTLNVTSSYVVYGGRVIEMGKVGSQLFHAVFNFCPNGEPSLDVYMFSSKIMSGVTSLPLTS